MGTEDHPGGKQLIRLRWWPKIPWRGPVLALCFAGLTLAAAQVEAWPAAAVLACGALLPALHIVEQGMAAMATITETIGQLQDGGW
jgi:hypothetical protein